MADNPNSEVSPQALEAALNQAQSITKDGRSWVIPVVTAAILSALFAAYYFVYVGSRREYLANRNFRALALLGNQLQTLISIHGSILEFYSDLADPNRRPSHRQRQNQDIDKFLVIHREDRTPDLTKRAQNAEARRDYLKFLAPSFELEEVPIPPTANSAKAASRLRVQRHNGRWELLFTHRHELNHTDYMGSLELEDLLDPLVGSLPFDDILLVSDKGAIVYQHKKAGPQFTTLASLMRAQNGKTADSAGAADKKPAGPERPAASPDTGEIIPVEQNSDPAWRRNSMHLADVTLAGTGYKLFLQPVIIDVFSSAPSQQEPAREWVLCGLRSSDSLEWEALSISYGFIIWFTAVFFAICISGPVLKIIFMNQRERLRLRELALLGLFLVLLGSVFTLAALDAVQFPRHDETETQLRRLAGNLAQNAHQELHDMRAQLMTWCATKDLHDDLKTAAGKEVIRTATERPDVKIPPANDYPYLSNAFWTDDDGHQIVKWSTSAYVTPLIDISGLPLFSRPKRTYLDGAGPPFYFSSVLPPNKLEYLATMGMKTCDCNPALCTSDIRGDVSGGFTFLTAQPFSLIDPILPFGYGFALLDDTGTVVFHADKTRNMRENFRLETDWNRQLYAATFGHAAPRPLPFKYLGKDYRAIVVPVNGLTQAPWSLVVYRDLTSVRTLKLQTLTMASTLLLWILGAPVLIVVVFCAIRRPPVVPEWLWPNRGRMGTYLALICLYSALIVLLLLLGFSRSSEQSVIVCTAIPYAALLLTVMCFRKFPSWAERPRAGNVNRFAAASSMLAGLGAVGILLALISRTAHGRELALWTCGVLAAAPLVSKPRHYLLYRLRHWHPAEMEAQRDSDQPEPRWLNSRNGYFLSALLLLLLLGVLVPMSLFHASVMVERRLAVKQAQLHLAATLTQRRAALQDGCQSEEESNQAACDKFRNDKLLLSKLVVDPAETADGAPVVVPHSLPQGQELYSGFFSRVVYSLHHDYNDAAAEMLGVIRDRAHSRKGAGLSDWSWKEESSQVTLTWHGLRPWDRKAPEEDLQISTGIPTASLSGALVGLGVAAGVIFVIGGFLWLLAQKIFLFRVMPLKITGARQVGESIRQGRSVLILLPPVSDWQLDAPKTTLDLKRVAIGPKWAETLELDCLPPNSLIEIRPFEYGADDPEMESQKYVLLDKLLHRENTQVAAVMTVPASSKDYRRMYPDLEVIDLRDEPFQWLKAFEGPARDLIWKECGPMAALWPIGAHLAADIKHEPIDSDDTIVSEMLERADGYYRLVWNECSKDQKFVLAQLAGDGALNPTNGRAIRQLMRRGLIVKDPQFRIMNESFRRFLRSATTPELKQEWLHESRRSGWGKLHGAFFITITLLGVFLLTTQNALWQSSAAYVTTALGALGTVAKLFNTFRGGGTTAKAN